MKSVISNKNIKSVFIRGVDYVGALAMIMPVYRSIREQFPEAHIAVGLKSWSKNILEGSSFVDEIIPYDMGRQLYEAAPDDRTFITLSGGHNDRDYLGNAKYRNGLRTFFGIPDAIGEEGGRQID